MIKITWIWIPSIWGYVHTPSFDQGGGEGDVDSTAAIEDKTHFNREQASCVKGPRLVKSVAPVGSR